jgi:hypothetical protein
VRRACSTSCESARTAGRSAPERLGPAGRSVKSTGGCRRRRPTAWRCNRRGRVSGRLQVVGEQGDADRSAGCRRNAPRRGGQGPDRRTPAGRRQRAPGVDESLQGRALGGLAHERRDQFTDLGLRRKACSTTGCIRPMVAERSAPAIPSARCRRRVAARRAVAGASGGSLRRDEATPRRLQEFPEARGWPLPGVALATATTWRWGIASGRVQGATANADRRGSALRRPAAEGEHMALALKRESGFRQEALGPGACAWRSRSARMVHAVRRLGRQHQRWRQDPQHGPIRQVSLRTP